MARGLTQEEFINKCTETHGDRYDYSKTTYKNSRTRVIITCKKHGDFNQFPLHHCNKGCNCLNVMMQNL